MATIDLHQKPFDDATITKLEIFENYAKEWLPTFVMSYPDKDLWIFDFFAGTGYDMVRVTGSPDDSYKQQLDLFEGHLPTKIDTFQNNLKDLILSKKITTNKEAYDYTLEQGHLDKHANDIIRKMKNDGLIKYETRSPMVNYEQVYKNQKIVEYFLMP